MATRTASLRSGRRCNISTAPADVSSAPIDATLKTCAADSALGWAVKLFGQTLSEEKKTEGFRNSPVEVTSTLRQLKLTVSRPTAPEGALPELFRQSGRCINSTDAGIAVV